MSYPDLEHNHAILVSELAKPGHEIVKDLDTLKAHHLHMAVGIAGEAGELLDAIKKHAIYNKPLDYDNVVEELGDLEFYMQGLRAMLNISREETLVQNTKKLRQRYASGRYSDAQAQARADKA